MLSLAMPWAFVLLPLPFFIHRYLPPAKDAPPNRALFVPYYHQLITQLQQGPATDPWRLLMLVLIWLCLVVAAAQPLRLGKAQALPNQGREILLAVDISGSMRERDMQINKRPASRLDAVKKVVSEFIQRREGDRVGLILFGSQAYLQAPLTFDTHTVEQFLQEAQLGFAGKETAIGDAIGLALKRFQHQGKQPPVLILLTDGENTTGEVSPEQAAKLAKSLNTKIYTIGIGADKLLVQGLFGKRHINPSAGLDENSLMMIAKLTQGRYFRARDTQGLEDIYQLLDQLEPVEQEAQWIRPQQALFMWPLTLALLLSLLMAVKTLSQTYNKGQRHG